MFGPQIRITRGIMVAMPRLSEPALIASRSFRQQCSVSSAMTDRVCSANEMAPRRSTTATAPSSVLAKTR